MESQSPPYHCLSLHPTTASVLSLRFRIRYGGGEAKSGALYVLGEQYDHKDGAGREDALFLVKQGGVFTSGHE